MLCFPPLYHHHILALCVAHIDTHIDKAPHTGNTGAMVTPPDVLRASLERHNATFETLLNLIPARYYLVQELSEEQVGVVGGY